jgi:ABC transport system ATP-binding/permease protein
VFDTVGDGNDTVTANGNTRHVHAYLEDFLFPPERARSPVKALSGGERNRLLLARLFTRPANVLVLDEPTNDLDLETLELLEAQLAEWPGTLLLVSHDRAFLDNVVTSTLVFEGGGRVQEYVGGYEDWIRQRGVPQKPPVAPASEPGRAAPSPRAPQVIEQGAGRTKLDSEAKKLSFKERRELSELPARIESLESEHRALEARMASPSFYKEGGGTIAQTLARLEELQRSLSEAYGRWADLESKGA